MHSTFFSRNTLMNTIEINVNDIKVSNPYRKDMGDVEALARSIEEVGLLQPIGITADCQLVFGERRLQACRDVLGQETILARIVPVESVLLGQIAENTMRKSFTPSELVAIVEALGSFEHGGDRRSDQARKCGVEKVTLEEAARRVGWSKDMFARAQRVCDQGVPELRDAMDDERVSISAAAEISDEEPEVQRRVLESSPSEIAKIAADIRVAKKMKRLQDRREILAKISVPAERPWTITEDQSVVPCAALITDPPYGVSSEAWDQDIERTTRDWASRWNDCGAHFIATFVAQKHLFEARRWFDESFTNYQFVQMLPAVYPNSNTRRLSRQEFVRNWDAILLYRRKDSDRRVNPSASSWTDEFSELAALTWTFPQSNFTEDSMKVHPFQKPVALLEWLVLNLTLPGEVVADPFAGSGTLGIAATRLGRRSHLIEIDPEYRALAEQRIAAFGAPAKATSDAA